jgi:hypothetical protein
MQIGQACFQHFSKRSESIGNVSLYKAALHLLSAERFDLCAPRFSASQCLFSDWAETTDGMDQFSMSSQQISAFLNRLRKNSITPSLQARMRPPRPLTKLRKALQLFLK